MSIEGTSTKNSEQNWESNLKEHNNFDDRINFIWSKSVQKKKKYLSRLNKGGIPHKMLTH